MRFTLWDGVSVVHGIPAETLQASYPLPAAGRLLIVEDDDGTLRMIQNVMPGQPGFAPITGDTLAAAEAYITTLLDPDTTSAPATPAYTEGQVAIVEVTATDPLAIRVGGPDGTTYTDEQVRRHAGYAPTVGDDVEAVWTAGAWLVRDAVVSGSAA